MYDEVYKGYEEERLRIQEKMKKVDLRSPEYKEYFDRLKEVQTLIANQRTIEREDKRVEIEAWKARESELKSKKSSVNWIELLKVAVFGGVAIAALNYESGGNVFKLDTTKNLMRLNKI